MNYSNHSPSMSPNPKYNKIKSTLLNRNLDRHDSSKRISMEKSKYKDRKLQIKKRIRKLSSSSRRLLNKHMENSKKTSSLGNIIDRKKSSLTSDRLKDVYGIKYRKRNKNQFAQKRLYDSLIPQEDDHLFKSRHFDYIEEWANKITQDLEIISKENKKIKKQNQTLKRELRACRESNKKQKRNRSKDKSPAGSKYLRSLERERYYIPQFDNLDQGSKFREIKKKIRDFDYSSNSVSKNAITYHAQKLLFLNKLKQSDKLFKGIGSKNLKKKTIKKSKSPPRNEKKQSKVRLINNNLSQIN